MIFLTKWDLNILAWEWSNLLLWRQKFMAYNKSFDSSLFNMYVLDIF